MKDSIEFLKLFERLNYPVLREEVYRPYNLNIVGVRNTLGRVNHFDDFIHVYYERKGEWIHKEFPATTYPGSDSLLKPPNPNGTAILRVGQYTYQKGLHKGKYEALIQKSPVTVYRDSNRDLVYDKLHKTTQIGFFGINIHSASFGALWVGPNSAGCQVIRSGFDEFMGLINRSLRYRENSFTYSLVEI
jgi:hypothetical protein